MRRKDTQRVFSDDPEIQKSLVHSIRDGVAFSIMTGVGENYFSAFALFLRASAPQIGMLASLPTLLASFSQLFSVWLGKRTGYRKEIIVAGAILQALVLVPLMVLPLIFEDYAIPILIACVVIYYIGPHLGSPQWGGMMGDIVPEKRRGRFFGRRTRLSSIAGFIALLGGGAVLHFYSLAGATYSGFVTIFSIGLLARLISAYNLIQMKDPGGHRPAEEDPWHFDFIHRMRRSRFLRFSTYFALMNFGVAISGPYIAVHMLRDLHFSYMQFSFNMGASVLVQFLTLNRWGRLSDLFGNRLILLVTGFTIPFIPSLWILSSNYVYLLCIQALSGLVWSGFTLSATNFVYDLTPAHKRVTYMAAHNVLASCAIFAGAMTGGYLVSVVPTSITVFQHDFSWSHALYGVFFTATLVRLSVALIFLTRLKEVRAVRNMTVPGLIFRVTRIHPTAGLSFDVVGRRQRKMKD